MAEVVAPATVVDARQVPVEGESLEIRDTAIDVEKVMARIRGSIEEKKKSRVYRQDAFLAQGIDLPQLNESNRSIADHLALLRYAARIDLQGEQITSHRPLMGFAIKSAKRLTRLCIRKYTDSIFARQNHFNAELISVLSEMNERLEASKAENERLKEQLEALTKR